MNGVAKLYHSPKKEKNCLSQEFHYMKCQAFNPFPSSVMAHSPLRKKNKTRWWNEDFSPKYNYGAFCKVLYKAIRNYSWKLARREKYFVFNVCIFYFDFFIGKKLLSALCQAETAVSPPVRFRILSKGTEDEYSHPWKMAVTPMESCAWCQSRLLHSSGFSFKLDQTSETTFRYQQSQYAD